MVYKCCWTTVRKYTKSSRSARVMPNQRAPPQKICEKYTLCLCRPVSGVRKGPLLLLVYEKSKGEVRIILTH